MNYRIRKPERRELKETMSTDYERLKFVSKARANIETRYALCNINVDKKWVEATDGHRLHRALLSMDIEDGLYQLLWDKQTIVLIPSQEQAKFPISEHLLKITTDESIDIYFYDNANSNPSIYTIAWQLMKHISAPINIEYLRPLEGIQWTAYQNRPNEQIIFISENDIRAIVMPLRGDK